MAKLSKSEVLNLAQLSKIELTADETEEFTDELSDILELVEKLSTVDMKGLDPTIQVTGLVNATRPDELIDYGANQKDLLKNAPNVKDNQLKVKRMLG